MAPARSITWYPGHMAKAFASLQRVIRNVDLVLEVRDARVPLSSSNPKLTALVANRRHIVVLNKADLVPASSREAALHLLRQQGFKAVAASCSTPGGVKQVLQEAVGWLRRERAASELSIMMAVGLPNSGKSSLINAAKLASKASGTLTGQQAYNKRALVGDRPGLTRQVAGFQVAAEPCVYMLDTPGIMIPAVPSDEVGLRLALAGAIRDSVVGEEAIVSYLLHLLHTCPRHAAALRRSGPAAGRGRQPRQGGGGGGRAARQDDPRLAAMRAALLDAASYVPEAAGAGGGGAWQQQQQGAWAPPPWPAAAAEWHPGAADTGGGVGGSGSDGGFWLQAAAADAAAGPAAGHGHGPMAAAAPAGWFPGADDEDEAGDAGARAWRLELLLRHLGVAGAINPSQQRGALIRVLQAFREGWLGKHCLDELPPEGNLRGTGKQADCGPHAPGWGTRWCWLSVRPTGGHSPWPRRHPRACRAARRLRCTPTRLLLALGERLQWEGAMPLAPPADAVA